MKPQYQNKDRKMSSWVKIERQIEKKEPEILWLSGG